MVMRAAEKRMERGSAIRKTAITEVRPRFIGRECPASVLIECPM
jgi:hypothetical protein